MAGNDTPENCARRTFLKATGAAGAAAALSGITAATPGRDPGPKTDEILVGVPANRDMASVRADVEAQVQNMAAGTDGGMEIAHENETLRYMAVEVPESLSADAREAYMEMLERLDGVKYAEQNETLYALSTPNDPRFGDQYAPQQVKAPTAWESESGSDATVAVVDQGVKYDEPDLQAQFGSNKGKDFVDGDGDPVPDDNANEFHGTHVAGITAATRNNDEGVAGISDATLLSGRALSEEGRGSTSDIADAVQWAADQGADIVNMSLGGGGYTDTMKNAVSYAVDNGCLPICAAGNGANQPGYDGGIEYPAKYDECVAVGAVDDNKERANFSQYGPNLDVVAPGVDVLSTWTESGTEYNRISGTSMATPAASGVAALGISANPDWSPTQLKSELRRATDDIGLPDNEQGEGLVNAEKIVGDVNQPPTASVSVDKRSVDVGGTVSFDGSGSSDPDGSISSYEWDLNGDGSFEESGTTTSKTYRSKGSYEATLKVTDDGGKTGTASVTISVGDNAPPVADFSASSTSVSVGDTVDFDASASSDSDGSISSYEWDLNGDGSVDATGVTASTSFERSGSYTVTLTVTDDDGATAEASATISVEGGRCGATSETVSGSGYLYGYYDDAAFAYTTQLDDPCQVSVSIEGAMFTDFDLYATADGRVPSTTDYDKRSISPDSSETVVFDDVSAGQEFGILVDSYEGNGDFTVTVEEVGQ